MRSKLESDSEPKTTSSNNTTNGTQEAEEQQFDYVEKEIDEDLICSICLLPFVDPISHNSDACGNTFCLKCVEKVSDCPMCREVDFKKNCSSAKTIAKLLDKLKVKCGMCKNIVLRGELKVHQEKYCPLHEAYQQVEEFKKKLEQEFQQKSEKLQREHEELIEIVKAEMEQHLREAKENLAKLEENLLQQFKKKEELLESNMKERESRILTREKLENSNKPIHINVRGTIMTVSLGDFIHNERESDNLFKKMFTGQHPCYQTPSKQFDDSIYFIDCDPNVFKHMIEWLQYGEIAELSNDMRRSVLNACKKFGLTNMSNDLSESINKESNSKQIMPMSQFDFMNIVNLTRSQKSALNLSGLDLRKLVINNTNLEKSEIIGSDFSGMNLKQTNFKGSNLRGCNFSNCDLTSVNLQECELDDCNFSNAILGKTNFSKSSLLNINLSNAIYKETKFIGAKFENVTGFQNRKLGSLDFSNSSFKSIEFCNSDLSNSNFTNCNAIDCNLESTILRKTNFEKSQFDNCRFNNKCKFEETSFKNSSMKNVSGLIGIDLVRVDLSNCKLTKTDFTVSYIFETNFLNCNFCMEVLRSKHNIISNCDLSGLFLNGDFTGFKFENVKFTNTNIEKSKFENSTFVKCKIQMNFKKDSLQHCNVIECDFNGSIFEEIDFTLIQANLETNSFNNCVFKNADLRELKDLSKFLGSTFDACLFNFKEFTNKHIQKIHFQNINLQDLGGFKFSAITVDIPWFNLLSSSVIVNSCDIAIGCELYSNTKSKSIPQLLYRGSRDGFKAEHFHSKCDNQGPTLTIIKSEHNQIFGGFTSKSWRSRSGECVTDSSAFIFKITDSNGSYQFEHFKIQREENAILVNQYYLALFGADIQIESDCNLNYRSRSNLGSYYELPKGYQKGSNEANNYLAGSYYFKVSEIEVFKINQ
ncbi:predicted protein [Naegleria gruberi]|uniref:Predicted protein n=1 Tax=Naegleria gruberi TaxID=5762 RepID=D2W263_NAEGR|nr:uncharacterized protein NAEGRDRAFT_82104 [Naegleria gruberi]EFC36767.1 predicted protein [Naegleria gruberi]|eukprot:XP_002669511.1 predicted protein [Naegleria gruberi strain NEG-M]